MKKNGSLEDKVRAKVVRTRIQDALILTLYLGVGTTLVAVAPAAMRLLKILPKPSYAQDKIGSRMRQARSRLMQRGMIGSVVDAQGRKVYQLTAKGKAYADMLMSNVSSHDHKEQWDGKWRIVIFDIWERRRGARDMLRRKLRRAGFVQIQASVWVTPYACEEFISFARTELKLGPSLVYIVADEIENDDKLRSYFKLPAHR